LNGLVLEIFDKLMNSPTCLRPVASALLDGHADDRLNGTSNVAGETPTDVDVHCCVNGVLHGLFRSAVCARGGVSRREVRFDQVVQSLRGCDAGDDVARPLTFGSDDLRGDAREQRFEVGVRLHAGVFFDHVFQGTHEAAFGEALFGFYGHRLSESGLGSVEVVLLVLTECRFGMSSS